MIRFATNNDIGGIVKLWHEAFGDSADEIKFFLSENFKPENTPIFEEGGEIASMLFLLDGKMSINNKEYSAYYLYAACTAEKYWGRGIMSDLLKYAEKTASDRKIHFICLLPAEASLYDYYSRYGYLSAFSKKSLNIKRGEITDIIETEFNFSNTANLENLREAVFKGFDRFKWDNNAIKFAFEHNKMYSGCSLVTDKGYALYTINDSKMLVKEFAFTQAKIIDFAVFAFKKYDIEEISFNLPYQFNCNLGSVKIHKNGMMLPISLESKTLITSVENAYLGLTLD